MILQTWIKFVCNHDFFLDRVPWTTMLAPVSQQPRFLQTRFEKLVIDGHANS